MSTDLDGQDAFDKILDRMVDAENRAQKERDSLWASQSMVSKLETDLTNSRREVAGMKDRLQVIEKAEAAVGGLYEAVALAVPILEADAPDPIAEKLKAALAEAKKFINPIPF